MDLPWFEPKLKESKVYILDSQTSNKCFNLLSAVLIDPTTQQIRVYNEASEPTFSCWNYTIKVFPITLLPNIPGTNDGKFQEEISSPIVGCSTNAVTQGEINVPLNPQNIPTGLDVSAIKKIGGLLFL
jgi:hypothetical protein